MTDDEILETVKALSVNGPDAERFWSKVEKTATCWLWKGKKDQRGYGRFRDGDRTVQAHRWSYEHLVGPISDDLEPDHLCRVRACVRPEHLEPVTHQVNVLRGVSLAALRARKTHCPRGHAYHDANTYRDRRGRRSCRRCMTAADARKTETRRALREAAYQTPTAYYEALHEARSKAGRFGGFRSGEARRAKAKEVA